MNCRRLVEFSARMGPIGSLGGSCLYYFGLAYVLGVVLGFLVLPLRRSCGDKPQLGADPFQYSDPYFTSREIYSAPVAAPSGLELILKRAHNLEN